MGKEELLERTQKYVRKLCETDTTGHDFWHIWRVCRNADKICEKEMGDSFLIQMICLLHDVYDHKFYSGDPREKLAETLKELDTEKLLSTSEKENIIESCVNLGYSSNVIEKQELSQEGKIAQDADRLDAVGAIAIARTFVYSGKKERPIYLPEEEQGVSAEEYQKNGSKTAIGHFYDKVLKVKDKMNTQTAKDLAEERHQFVQVYLNEFLDEWNGRK